MKSSYIIIATSLLLAACGTEEVKTAKTTKISLPNVSVITAKKGNFSHSFLIQGAVESDKNIILTPETGGQITNLPIKEGQLVTQGQVIAAFDTDILNASQKELETQLSTAKYFYDKQLSLFNQGVGTEVAVKQAEGQYNALKQTMQSIQTQKAKFTLTAPFSGFIEELYAVEGQMTAPGMPIARLLNLEELSASADVSESYLNDLSEGNLVKVSFPALGNLALDSLKINRISKFINPANRTIKVEVTLPQGNKKILPNLMAVLEIVDYSDTSAISIPSSTIIRNQGEPFVFILSDSNTTIKVPVATGRSSKNQTEILSGLNGGERVIDKGSKELKEHKKVNILSIK